MYRRASHHVRSGLLTILLFVASQATADTLDATLRAEMDRQHVPGMALAVLHEGRIVKLRGYGLAHVELAVPVHPETVFEIGSLTKPLTACAVLLLVDDGRVALDDPVGTHLPGLPEAWHGVTVRQLLGHTGGLKDYTDPDVADFFVLAHRAQTREGIVASVADRPLAFPPGTRFDYSNTGYFVLGLLIEKLSGSTYWQFLDQRIFTPLGMDQTRPTDPRAVVTGRAAGYLFRDDALERIPTTEPMAAFSAGGLMSTVVDLAKWEAALATGSLLSEASREAMWTAGTTDDGSGTTDSGYGLGWRVMTARDQQLVMHRGATPGFRSGLFRYRSSGITIIQLLNFGIVPEGGGHVDVPLVRAIADTYVPAPEAR